MQVTKHLISRRKQPDHWCLKDYGDLYQKAALVMETLYIISQHRRSLRGFMKGKCNTDGEYTPNSGKSEAKCKRGQLAT